MPMNTVPTLFNEQRAERLAHLIRAGRVFASSSASDLNPVFSALLRGRNPNEGLVTGLVLLRQIRRDPALLADALRQGIDPEAWADQIREALGDAPVYDFERFA